MVRKDAPSSIVAPGLVRDKTRARMGELMQARAEEGRLQGNGIRMGVFTGFLNR